MKFTPRFPTFRARIVTLAILFADPCHHGLHAIVVAGILSLLAAVPDFIDLSYGSSVRIFSSDAPSLPKAYTDALMGLAIGPLAGFCATAAYPGEQVRWADAPTRRQAVTGSSPR
jgi:hypothetical protein